MSAIDRIRVERPGGFPISRPTDPPPSPQQTPAPSRSPAIDRITGTPSRGGSSRSPPSTGGSVTPAPPPRVITPVVTQRTTQLLSPTPARSSIPYNQAVETIRTTVFVDDTGKEVDRKVEVIRQDIPRQTQSRPTRSLLTDTSPTTRTIRESDTDIAQALRISQAVDTRVQRQAEEQRRSMSTVQPIRFQTVSERAQFSFIQGAYARSPELGAVTEFFSTPVFGIGAFGERTVRESRGIIPLQLAKDIPRGATQLYRTARDEPAEFRRMQVSPGGFIAQSFLTAPVVGGAVVGTARALTPSRYIRTRTRLPQQNIQFESFTETRQMGRGTFDVRQSIPTPAQRTTTLLRFQETPTGIIDRLRGRRVQTTIQTSPTGRQTITRTLGDAQDIYVFPRESSRARVTRIRGERRLPTRTVDAPLLDTEVPLSFTPSNVIPQQATVATTRVRAPLTDALGIRTARTSQMTISGVDRGTLRQTRYTGQLDRVDIQDFSARSFPTATARTETYLALQGTRQIPIGTISTELSARPTRLRISRTGEVSRERVRTDSRIIDDTRIVQDISLTPDPAQETLLRTGITANIRLQREFIIPTQARNTLGYLVPRGKRAQISLSRTRTQLTPSRTIIQDVAPPRLPQQTPINIRIRRPSPIATQQTPRLRGRFGAFYSTPSAVLSATRVSTISRPSQQFIPRQTPVTIQRTSPITSFIQRTSQTQQLQRTFSPQLQFRPTSPISSGIRTPRAGIPIAPPPPFRLPRIPSGGTLGYPRRSISERARRGYTRSLAGIGRASRREASLIDIGSGLTVRF
jgi:hypothetical protein